MQRSKRFSARVLEAFNGAGLAPTLAVRVATASSPAEILVYDEIGAWGITAGDFVSALASVPAGPLRVRINSPGGDVFDGMAMYNALAARAAASPVECVVDGIAASAASFLAMAGKVTMAEASMFMIHNAWGVVVGNKESLRSTADTLGRIDEQMVGIYSRKTGQAPESIAAMMDAETWLTPAEAKAGGFCDTIAETPAAAASVARPARAVALRAALRAADPDSDGDADPATVPEAIAQAIEMLQDAYEMATGAEYVAPPDNDDPAASASASAIRQRRLRIAESS